MVQIKASKKAGGNGSILGASCSFRMAFQMALYSSPRKYIKIASAMRVTQSIRLVYSQAIQGEACQTKVGVE